MPHHIRGPDKPKRRYNPIYSQFGEQSRALPWEDYYLQDPEINLDPGPGFHDALVDEYFFGMAPGNATEQLNELAPGMGTAAFIGSMGIPGPNWLRAIGAAGKAIGKGVGKVGGAIGRAVGASDFMPALRSSMDPYATTADVPPSLGGIAGLSLGTPTGLGRFAVDEATGGHKRAEALRRATESYNEHYARETHPEMLKAFDDALGPVNDHKLLPPAPEPRGLLGPGRADDGEALIGEDASMDDIFARIEELLSQGRVDDADALLELTGTTLDDLARTTPEQRIIDALIESSDDKYFKGSPDDNMDFPGGVNIDDTGFISHVDDVKAPNGPLLYHRDLPGDPAYIDPISDAIDEALRNKMPEDVFNKMKAGRDDIENIEFSDIDDLASMFGVQRFVTDAMQDIKKSTDDELMDLAGELLIPYENLTRDQDANRRLITEYLSKEMRRRGMIPPPGLP